jgi:hypothetical protein
MSLPHRLKLKNIPPKAGYAAEAAAGGAAAAPPPSDFRSPKGFPYSGQRLLSTSSEDSTPKADRGQLKPDLLEKRDMIRRADISMVTKLPFVNEKLRLHVN